jgi:cytochrome c2
MIMYCSTAPWSFAPENADANTISSEVTEITKTTEATENNTAQKIQAGENLFKSICVHCHNTTYDESRIGASGLRGVIDLHDEAWLNQWVKGSEAFAKTDVAAHDLTNSNRFGLACPTLPTMQNDNNRKAVIEYLKTLK